MPIWWRRARFSSCRAAREREIEASVARSVFREMSIGEENYERSIIPLRSDISRFSRGTVFSDGQNARPQHPHPEASQSRVPEAAIANHVQNEPSKSGNISPAFP